MELNNIKIKTEYNYNSNGSLADEISKPNYYLLIEIPIPGGSANFLIPTNKEINDTIEKATQLCTSTTKGLRY